MRMLLTKIFMRDRGQRNYISFRTITESIAIGEDIQQVLFNAQHNGSAPPGAEVVGLIPLSEAERIPGLALAREKPNGIWSAWVWKNVLGDPAFVGWERSATWNEFCLQQIGKPRPATTGSPSRRRDREPDYAPHYWDLPKVTEDNAKQLGEDYMAAVRASAGDKRRVS